MSDKDGADDILFARKLCKSILDLLNDEDKKDHKGGDNDDEDEEQGDYRIPLDKLPPGPWIADHTNHPRDEYKFKASGYRCKIQRPGHDWVWNGYVTLPDGHPDLDKGYDEMSEFVKVHCGFTYRQGNTFGFDTQHFCDIVPGLLAMRMPIDPTAEYWTFEMVLEEVKRVAAQFRERHV
jgi:hypothetical protein